MDTLLLDVADHLETGGSAFASPRNVADHIEPRTIQTPALDLIDRKLIDAYEGRGKRRVIISMPPQEGKALALDTPIATPSGWTTMGALRVGDQVFDRYGKPCNVTWVSPTWTDRPCYMVRTGDGEAVEVDGAHEWVARLDRRRGERIYETTALARARIKSAQITGAPGLELPDAELPLDPYVLGAWLGDGHSKGAMITCADEEIVERIRAAGVPCRKGRAKYLWTLAPEGGSSKASPVRLALVGLGVWGNKHVPDAYLRGSGTQRLALLQGLVDTDGYVDPRGQVEFCATNEQLARDVAHLVFSLGAKATVHEGRATIDGRDCGPKWRVRFFLANAAWITRKAERCADSPVARVRYVWAEPTESVPTVCIEVDSPDHTFLAGRSLLPTHNSQRVSRYYPTWLLKQDPDLRIAIVSYADALARRWGRQVRNDLRDNPDIGLTVRADTAAANEWQLAHYQGGVITAGIESGLTGRPVDVLIIDDPLKGRQEADSETYREMNKDWWRSVAQTRLGEESIVILVMTRWHEDDLAGFLTGPENEGRDEWDVLNIPAQADHNPERGETDPLGREPGEYMISARGRTVAGWESRKINAGSRDWNALFQGRPAPAEGGVLKRSWWKYYDIPRHVERADGTMWAIGADQVLMSWDMAFKDTDGSDYVVGTVWGRRGPRAWLLDIVHARMDFSATIVAFKSLVARWPQALLKLVEDKANGPAVINQLQKEIGGIVAFSPTDSKLARAYSMQPFLEAGNFELPDPMLDPRVVGFVDECAAFPNGAHDDRVDSFTQAGIRMFIIGAGLDEFMIELTAGQKRGQMDEDAPHTAPWAQGGDNPGAPALPAPDTADGTDMRPPWLGP